MMDTIFFPEFASWESTLSCSMRCEHCGLSAGPLQGCERGREFNTSEAMQMFSDIASLGVKRLCISGGEFTVRKDWKILLEAALQKFEAVRQITNGFIGERILREIEKIQLHEKITLSVSVDGLEDTHDKNRCKNSFNKVSEIFQSDSPIYRTAITTVMNKNIDELGDLFLWLMNRNVSVWSIQIGLPEGRMPYSEFIGIDKIKFLADSILDWQTFARGIMEIIPDDCFGYCHKMRNEYPWHGCQAGRNLVTILSNGDVTGCPTTFDVPCGNIREQSIQEIWNGDKMNNFRLNIPVCDLCENRKCGGGCRAVYKCFKKQFCF